MRIKKTVAAVLLCLVPAASPLTAEPAAAVLLLHGRGTDWGPVRRLEADGAFVFGSCDFGTLTWERLQGFNAVMLFDMSRYNPDSDTVNHTEIGPAGFERVADLLDRYVREGGGLYIYGVSFSHMGQGLATETLNRFLQRFEARAPFELLRDEPREVRQPEGGKILYALADRIVEHPAVAGVKHLWYAIGPFSYGPWTRPLEIRPAWQPLIFTSPAYTSVPLGNASGHAASKTNETSAISGERAAIYAVRAVGKGRIVLNGGESTISFYGYDFSDFADRHWQRIGMEKGLNELPSHGLELLMSSLRWLAAPSLRIGIFGGYRRPPAEAWRPRHAKPILWPPAGSVHGALPFRKGLFAAFPAGCGGTGSLTNFADIARRQGLDYLVCAADFELADATAWARLQQDCQAASDDTFVAIPAVMTRDHLGNTFLQTGPRAWPRYERLDPDQPKRVRDHLGYWMNDGGFPLRAVLRFADGQYPPGLHSGYDSFVVRTWKDGAIIDEAVTGFLQNQEQGDRSRILSVSLVRDPAELANVKEYTWINARTFDELAKQLLTKQFTGAAASYVSSGPRIRQWSVENARRNTFGESNVPGTERWRLRLAVDSDVPLSRVTIHDGTHLFRCFALSGTNAHVTVDGLHSARHVLTAIVEDRQGGRAMTGAIEVQDSRFVQTFCSDRCNIMGGQSVIRDAEGRETTVPASTMFYKAGRLIVSTVCKGEALPGIDGSGQRTRFFLSNSLNLHAARQDRSEGRGKVHLIERPWESADGLIFNAPILKRSPTTDHQIYGHAPYVPLEEPRIDARIRQTHFYRSPMYPSPATATFSMTAREAVTPKPGWHGFSLQFASYWGTPTPYAIVRDDQVIAQGPSPDESAGTSWRGQMQPGDFLYLPKYGEGFYLIGESPLDVVLDCVPSRKWMRIYVGRFDLLPLAAGESVEARLLLLRSAATGDEGLRQWIDFRHAYGLTVAPAYAVNLSQGTVGSTTYLLQLQAKDGGITGRFDIGMLPQRLPVKISGVNPLWTAGVVDNTRHTWKPVGGEGDALYTTLNPALGAQDLFIGNLLSADHATLRLTLLPDNADGHIYAAVHNPSEASVTATIRVPVTTWLLPVQAHSLTVPPMSTTRLQLHAQAKGDPP